MNRMKLRFLALTLFLFGAIVVSLGLGRYFIAPETVVRILFTPLFSLSPDWSPQAETVLYGVRLPRVLMGVLIGAGLSCAGAVYQSVFQNPLVSPDLLGASAGSGRRWGCIWSLVILPSRSVPSHLAFSPSRQWF